MEQGNQRASSTFDTKADAQAKGCDMSRHQRVEHIDKRMDSIIGERNS